MTADNDQEIEVKFYLSNPASFHSRLTSVGAELITPRILETNWRYDTPDLSFSRSFQVLRLRQDDVIRLTYKGPAEPDQPVSTRRELEFGVTSLEMAQKFLVALGFHVLVMYEKYRTTYALGGVLITLDEMPYGNFCELEGPDAITIHMLAEQLHLDWEARCLDSYLGIFQRVKASRGLELQNLCFDAFNGYTIFPEDLGVRPADHH